MTVILLSADLTVMSRVQGAAAQAGVSTRVVSSAAALNELASGEPATLLIIDLNSPQLDVRSVVERFRATSPEGRIVAFGPHVHEERLAAARAAGCDQVVSRGQFFAQADAIFGAGR
jgi:CheY-like chemotaxis protein